MTGNKTGETITRQEFDKMMMNEDLNLNATARMVLMAHAIHMNYKDKPVTSYKSLEHVATFAGINKDTAKKYREALEADGFLIDSGDREQSGKFHYLTRFYLGKGEVQTPVLMRKKPSNAKNVAPSHSDSASKPLRHTRGK